MLATDSHSVKHSDNGCSQVKNELNKIDPGVHGTVPSKQTSDDKSRKRKRGRTSDPSSGPERRGFDRGGPQYNALRDKNWLCNVQQAHLHGLTDANVKQLPEQSQDSFSIPTADVEEASAVLSGNGMSISQRAHLRDIESCISALRLAQTITIECAIEKLLAERDRVLINPPY
ncbi:hypothetical protein V501_03019 [Pseudogymnoascus sp. VKM F-4519 (FW-2642)]|nr:hypothetical protein V501_03019 [Pseudogymnoascus sp. VKM F-4519 (FW-2642)]